jgi:hypothetical protein
MLTFVDQFGLRMAFFTLAAFFGGWKERQAGEG